MSARVRLPDGSVVVPAERVELRAWVFRRRWWARLVAHSLHYFWLPCPRCGAAFSGREWRRWGHPTLPEGEDGRAQGICLPCAVETREAYLHFLKPWP